MYIDHFFYIIGVIAISYKAITLVSYENHDDSERPKIGTQDE
jgi:hypothetical protein